MDDYILYIIDVAEMMQDIIIIVGLRKGNFNKWQARGSLRRKEGGIILLPLPIMLPSSLKNNYAV